MRYVSGLFAGAACAGIACCSATAAPIFSGTYVLTVQEVCPSVVTYTRNGNGMVTSITNPGSGDANTNLLTLTFTPGAGTPNAGTVKGAGYQAETGGLLQLPNVALQPDLKPLSVSTTYSNTATTLTVAGTGAIAPPNVIYGTVKSGVVQTASFIGLTSFSGGAKPITTVTCTQQGTLVRNQ